MAQNVYENVRNKYALTDFRKAKYQNPTFAILEIHFGS
jgi:hypothetical protein